MTMANFTSILTILVLVSSAFGRPATSDSDNYISLLDGLEGLELKKENTNTGIDDFQDADDKSIMVVDSNDESEFELPIDKFYEDKSESNTVDMFDRKSLSVLRKEIRTLRRQLIGLAHGHSKSSNGHIKRMHRTSVEPLSNKIKSKDGNTERNIKNSESGLSPMLHRQKRSGGYKSNRDAGQIADSNTDYMSVNNELTDITARNTQLKKAVEKHLEYFLADMLLLFKYDMDKLARESSINTSRPRQQRKPRSRPKRDLRSLLHNVNVRNILKKYFSEKGTDENGKPVLRFG